MKIYLVHQNRVYSEVFISIFCMLMCLFDVVWIFIYTLVYLARYQRSRNRPQSKRRKSSWNCEYRNLIFSLSFFVRWIRREILLLCCRVLIP